MDCRHSSESLCSCLIRLSSGTQKAAGLSGESPATCKRPSDGHVSHVSTFRLLVSVLRRKSLPRQLNKAFFSLLDPPTHLVDITVAHDEVNSVWVAPGR